MESHKGLKSFYQWSKFMATLLVECGRHDMFVAMESHTIPAMNPDYYGFWFTNGKGRMSSVKVFDVAVVASEDPGLIARYIVANELKKFSAAIEDMPVEKLNDAVGGCSHVDEHTG